MIVTASDKVKSSVQKVNLVVNMIRGEKVEKAIMLLSFSKKRISFHVKKILFSSVSNAQNVYDADIDSLYVHKILVGKAKGMKRGRFRGRGKSAKIEKHYSNVKIFVNDLVS